MQQQVTWKQLVADTLKQMGGGASLKDITLRLANEPKRPQTATWQATIRRVVRQYKIFEPVQMAGGFAGYRLVTLEPPELKGGTAKEDPHGEQQGMLLRLGTLCGYETFTNETDKTIRKFGGQPIAKLATIRNDAEALKALPLKKMRQTDVMWMAEDSEGLYPKYAFEVENSTGVKHGLLRLLRIPDRFGARLYIVAPGDEEAKLFNRYIAETPFRDHAQRFQFRFYNEVKNFYESGTLFDTHRKSWSVQFAGRP